MPVEVKTHVKFTPGSSPWPLMIVDMVYVPRGSGNRNKARAMAERWRESDVMAPFLEKVVVGASKVRVHLRCSPAFTQAMARVREEEAARVDVPGQLGLFAG